MDTPGPVDMIVPVREHYPKHYCPKCGIKVVPEEQIQQMDRDEERGRVLTWLFLVVTVILCFVMESAGGPDDHFWWAGLVLGGFATFLVWAFSGGPSLWGD